MTTQRWRSGISTRPFTLTCPVWNQPYTPDPADYVYNTNSTYVWCLCCLAHGNRKLHLVDDSWLPAWEQRETATDQVAVAERV